MRNSLDNAKGLANAANVRVNLGEANALISGKFFVTGVVGGSATPALCSSSKSQRTRQSTQFLSPQLFLNNGATAAAVVYDCSGVYLETDC